MSIVEVHKNPSSTKREQTASVCSGFPDKYSTRRAGNGGETEGERGRKMERERERVIEGVCGGVREKETSVKRLEGEFNV